MTTPTNEFDLLTRAEILERITNISYASLPVSESVVEQDLGPDVMEMVDFETDFIIDSLNVARELARAGRYDMATVECDKIMRGAEEVFRAFAVTMGRDAIRTLVGTDAAGEPSGMSPRGEECLAAYDAAFGDLNMKASEAAAQLAKTVMPKAMGDIQAKIAEKLAEVTGRTIEEVQDILNAGTEGLLGGDAA